MTASNIYLELSREFNVGHVRAVLSSGQAVVLHRLSVTSKDGDWILREDDQALEHILAVLERRGARYRFGAPLDLRWLRGGWSSHLQFQHDGLRVRTDFVTRPPRLSAAELVCIWDSAAGDVPFLAAAELARVKMTDREKDWPVVGELVRRIDDRRQRLLLSRSARDLVELAHAAPALAEALVGERPLLARIGDGREALEAALDAERRTLMRDNEIRLSGYEAMTREWAAAWPELERELHALPLREAHARMVSAARAVLPAGPGSAGTAATETIR